MANELLQQQITAALFGVAIGDAMGVPAEFNPRDILTQHPITDMVGYGTHNQPPGTYSDDTALTLCLAENLANGYNTKVLGQYFIDWVRIKFWTARNEVFHIGIATRNSIYNLSQGVDPSLSGGDTEWDNGNGSLMRILPMVFYIKDKSIEERFKFTKEVSSLTHRHIRSIISCFYYLEFARLLLEGKDKFEVYKELQQTLPYFFQQHSIPANELQYLSRLLEQDIHSAGINDIRSSGYVIHTIEASIWCLLKHDNYKATILEAVNLGEDTDTTAAVAGGLAGILYGIEGIPSHWYEQIARKADIQDVARRMATTLS